MEGGSHSSTGMLSDEDIDEPGLVKHLKSLS